MKKILVSFFVLFFVSCSNSKAVNQNKKTTFILIHGALATRAAWIETEKQLAARGLNSAVLNVPGRENDHIKPQDVNLKMAAEKVCELVNKQSGDVILVGHSQGGALVVQALSSCSEKVRSLVFLTAVVPLSGETPFQMLDPKVDQGFGKITTFDKEAALFRLNKKAPIAELFMGDVPAEKAVEAVKAMVSEPIGIGTMPMNTPNSVIFSKPAYYIETTEDKIISIQTQRKIYSRIPNVKVYSMKTSHAPFLSQPSELADILGKISLN